MPIVVRLRHEMFNQPACRARLAATAAVHELVLVGTHNHMPVIERALIEELLNDGVIPVVLTGCDPPPAALTCWLGTVCQDAAPAVLPGEVTKTGF